MWKIVVPGLAMIAVTYAFARLSFGMFLPDISNTLGLDASDGGLVGSIGYISYSIALFFSSFAIHRFGFKRVNQIAGLTAVVGLVGMATATSLLHLGAGVFIAGLGSGLASPALSQMAYQTFTRTRVDQANTWINSGTSFGIILTGPVVLMFTEHWRLSFFMFAIVAFAVTLWNKRIIPNAYENRHVDEPNIDWTSTLRNGWSLITASVIVGFSSSIYWTFSRSFVTEQYNMTANESVLFWIVVGAAGVLGGVAGGLIQRIGLGLSYRMILVTLLSSVAMLTVHTPFAIYTSPALFGGAYIFLTGLLIVWATRTFVHLPALGVSMSFLALGIGQSLGSFIAGMVIDISSYPFAFILFACVGVIGLIIPVKDTND
ncbi:MFS transporter [Geomicrobium sp. JSM 1781026]|uniref:MFS transporter n=1 Tax=Geomicrobium sp. JSM 1781026 TaxID=3344580 RepID=UPI0035C20F52